MATPGQQAWITEQAAEAEDMLAWATSPGGKASFTAALEFAHRTGITVTEGEMAAILWTAHKAGENQS